MWLEKNRKTCLNASQKQAKIIEKNRDGNELMNWRRIIVAAMQFPNLDMSGLGGAIVKVGR